jgi:predicted house-cleaning NTP pyrophosphatase (Maf/HAM1 superfamily)
VGSVATVDVTRSKPSRVTWWHAGLRASIARERQQMEAQQKAKALMVERAKQKARAAQKELERALAIAADKSTAAAL